MIPFLRCMCAFLCNPSLSLCVCVCMQEVYGVRSVKNASTWKAIHNGAEVLVWWWGEPLPITEYPGSFGKPLLSQATCKGILIKSKGLAIAIGNVITFACQDLMASSAHSLQFSSSSAVSIAKLRRRAARSFLLLSRPFRSILRLGSEALFVPISQLSSRRGTNTFLVSGFHMTNRTRLLTNGLISRQNATITSSSDI